MDIRLAAIGQRPSWIPGAWPPAEREAFVEVRGLDSWNDHDDGWERRGTEHVAETIAWALLDDPSHVRWVKSLPDGTEDVSHRILTIDVDVETLVDNFEMLTGMIPVFRNPGEWAADTLATVTSPEVRRGGA